MSPFKLAMGWLPRTPLDVAKQRVGGDNPTTHRLEISRQEMFDEARESLEKEARRMKKYADQHRRPLEFFIEDKELLKLTPQILKKVSSKTQQRGLIPKFEGPFEVIKKVGEVVVPQNPGVSDELKSHPFLVHFSACFLSKKD